MKWIVEVIRYDKGKKVIEYDTVEADGYYTDDHNNLILYNGTYTEFMAYIKRGDYNNLVQQYHAYNYISIRPEKS